MHTEIGDSRRSRAIPVAATAAAAILAGVLVGASLTTAASQPANQVTFADATGQVTTLTTAGSIDTTNPFFQPLGTNGRTCDTCHRAAQAWTLTPAEVRQRFNNSKGQDPLFTNNDGANCEGADVSTLSARRSSFSLLLSKGLIRVGMTVPSQAEFKIAAVDDPYGCGAQPTVGMFRRPLPTTNLGFLSTVMWDGRETVPDQAIAADLASQARDATIGHAQGTAPPPDVLAQIVAFEMALFTAQTMDDNIGSLTAQGALGGPAALSTQSFCIGSNDPLGMLPLSMPGACNPAPPPFDPRVFTIFDAWNSANSSGRLAVARGQRIFNTRTFQIDNVQGLNGVDGSGPLHSTINGTCTVCHDTPNAGDHSVAMPLNIGVSDASRRTADLPLYTLQNLATGETVQTTDPGRAMVTGKWADIGKFKGPVLRALAARAPYFHNGSAGTLADVVEFYDTRFNIGLTSQEKSDLIAFLRVL